MREFYMVLRSWRKLISREKETREENQEQRTAPEFHVAFLCSIVIIIGSKNDWVAVSLLTSVCLPSMSMLPKLHDLYLIP